MNHEYVYDPENQTHVKSMVWGGAERPNKETKIPRTNPRIFSTFSLATIQYGP
jgi:hypothetical protein